MTDISLDIRGARVPVHIDGRGIFNAVIAGRGHRSETLNGLRDQLMATSRQTAVRVAVPFTLGGVSNLRDGIGTGIHANGNKILIRWADTGRTDQIESYRTVFRELSADEQAEYLRLSSAFHAASKAMRDWQGSHEINLHEAVSEALDEAARKLAAKEGRREIDLDQAVSEALDEATSEPTAKEES
jgi:hypothetical protein